MRTPPLILIVDDNPDNLDILQTRLASHGYEISTRSFVMRNRLYRPWVRAYSTLTSRSPIPREAAMPMVRDHGLHLDAPGSHGDNRCGWSCFR